jgi:hypothetical protein
MKVIVRSKNAWSLPSTSLVCIRSYVQLNDGGLGDKTICVCYYLICIEVSLMSILSARVTLHKGWNYFLDAVKYDHCRKLKS